MKKTFLFLITFFCLLNNTFSQARLFYTEQEIKDEFYFLNWEAGYGNETGARMIRADWDNIVITHSFNGYNQCIMTTVFPKTNEELFKRIKKYNLENIKISDLLWVEPSGINIELVPVEKGFMFVYWK